MRAVVQRVSQAKVLVQDKEISSIGRGLLALIGVKKDDREEDVEYIANKLCHLRIFEDEQGKMNLGVKEVQGEILLVSQFTLYGDARKGRRPSFTEAAGSAEGRELFELVAEKVSALGIRAKKGAFGEHMMVHLVNDGPCTIILDSRQLF